MVFITFPSSMDGLPLKPAWNHISRHFIGSGTLGANIGRWRTPNSLFSDPAIRAFLDQTAIRLDPACTEVQKFNLDLPYLVGYEGIVRKDFLTGWNIWTENREGFEVLVTDAPLVKTKQLNFLFAKKPSCWLIISIWAGITDSRPLSDTGWWKDWVFYNNR